MARLTEDAIKSRPQFTNAMFQREIDLRQVGFSRFDKLELLEDCFDVLDASHNPIRTLTGFPRMNRLRTITLHHAPLSFISKDVRDSLPNLLNLYAHRSAFSSLLDLSSLSAFASLQHLSIIGSPVCAKKPSDRQFVIAAVPSLKSYNLANVTPTERREADFRLLLAHAPCAEQFKELAGAARGWHDSQTAASTGDAPRKRARSGSMGVSPPAAVRSAPNSAAATSSAASDAATGAPDASSSSDDVSASATPVTAGAPPPGAVARSVQSLGDLARRAALRDLALWIEAQASPASGPTSDSVSDDEGSASDADSGADPTAHAADVPVDAPNGQSNDASSSSSSSSDDE